MNEEIHTIRRSFKGLPFISDRFDNGLLCAMVAKKRRSILGHDNSRPDADYLTPRVGAEYLASDNTRSVQAPWQQAEDLPRHRLDSVADAISDISAKIPAWSDLLRLPVRFVVPPDPAAMSGSEVYSPQTIGLGDSAFDAREYLEASLIHEFAHVWLGLLCEISTFDNGRGDTDYRLPSGTTRQSLRTVLIAAHFAACCGRYFGLDHPLVGHRLTYGPYARDCLAVCRNNSGLTLMGQYVWEELDSALSAPEPFDGRTYTGRKASIDAETRRPHSAEHSDQGAGTVQ